MNKHQSISKPIFIGVDFSDLVNVNSFKPE